jgi:hypothetical protein
MIVAVAVPAALFAAGTAGADETLPVGPSPAGRAHAPAALTTAVKQDRMVAARQTSLRGRRLRADDAATPPSPGTAPAMSASPALLAAPGDAPSSAFVHTAGARPPPPVADAAVSV